MTTNSTRRAPAALLTALVLVAGLGASVALAGPTPGGSGHRSGLVAPAGRSPRPASPSGPAGCFSWHFRPAVTVGALGPRPDPAAAVACVVARPGAGPVRA